MEKHFGNHDFIIPFGEKDEQSLDEIINLADEILMRQRIRDPIEGHMLAGALQQMTKYGRGPVDWEYPWEPRTQGELAQVVKEVMSVRRAMNQSVDPGYVLRLMEFSLNMQFTDLYPEIFPRQAREIDFWRDLAPFERINYEDLREEMFGELQSCMPDAYAIYHLFTVALARHGHDPRTVLDNGRSLGLGLKKWLDGRFSSIKVFQQPLPGQPIDRRALTPDRQMQAVIDELMVNAPVVEKIVAYDRTQVPNKGDAFRYGQALKRFYNHTFPMSEPIARPHEVDEFFELAYKDFERLTIIDHGIKAEDPLALAQLRDHLPTGRADIGIYSAMLFESQPAIVEQIRHNQQYLYNPGAVVFETDFFAMQKRKDAEPEFTRRNWWHHPGAFTTYARDPNNPDQPPVELARFLTRRGTEMWLTPAGRRLILEGKIF